MTADHSINKAMQSQIRTNTVNAVSRAATTNLLNHVCDVVVGRSSASGLVAVIGRIREGLNASIGVP